MSARRALGSLLAALAAGVACGGCGLLGGAPSGARSTSAAGATPTTAAGATPTTAAGASSTIAAAASSTTAAAATGPQLGARAIAGPQRTHELPTPPGRVQVLGGWRSPVQAVTVFAATYVNWQAATVAARLRGLAQVSLGQARSAMSTEAAEVARDRELHAGGIANSGTVEAVAPIRGSPDEYAVITRERTSAAHETAYQGLAPEWHVALATVSRLGDGLWALSGWQPEN